MIFFDKHTHKFSSRFINAPEGGGDAGILRSSLLDHKIHKLKHACGHQALTNLVLLYSRMGSSKET